MDTQKQQTIEQLQKQIEGKSAKEMLEFFIQKHSPNIALATSLSAQDQVLTDMICKISSGVKIFTLDTGRLPEETYDLIEATQKHYGISIEVMFPDRIKVESMAAEFGVNLFYKSLENRKLCCRIRKVEPLKRALKGLDVWICGLTKAQSITRTSLSAVQYDSLFGLIKLCPLIDWSNRQIWDYINTHNVPYSKLYERGYTSIGCAPCTRAAEPGSDIRSGRWWWEKPEHKECGLHLQETKSKGNN